MKTFIVGKLHGITVTHKSLDYHGSVTVDPILLSAAGMKPYEQVHVVNMNNGQRWITYLLPDRIAGSGTFALNGGGARRGEIGDRCVLMTYEMSEKFSGTHVIECDQFNRITHAFCYEDETDVAQ